MLETVLYSYRSIISIVHQRNSYSIIVSWCPSKEVAALEDASIAAVSLLSAITFWKTFSSAESLSSLTMDMVSGACHFITH